MSSGDGVYGVRLEEIDFEGPLDLLLFLIQKNEIDITDIPIALVTEQFLSYLERLTADQLEDAGDFLLMAATLMRIKARMLLPAPEGLEDEELEDPRRELVSRILEYQQYKEVARHLREQEQRALLLHSRGLWSPGSEAAAVAPESALPAERRVSLADLLRAFGAMLAARPAERAHHVDVVRVTLEEKVHLIRAVLAERGQVRFGELFPPRAPRIELVVTLIALLEMVRNGEVRLRQIGSFEEIDVLQGEPAAQGPDPAEGA